MTLLVSEVLYKAMFQHSLDRFGSRSSLALAHGEGLNSGKVIHNIVLIYGNRSPLELIFKVYPLRSEMLKYLLWNQKSSWTWIYLGQLVRENSARVALDLLDRLYIFHYLARLLYQSRLFEDYFCSQLKARKAAQKIQSPFQTFISPELPSDSFHIALLYFCSQQGNDLFQTT